MRTGDKEKERYGMQRIHLPGQPEAVADRVFVRQALAGDKDAFEALVRRYHR
jgi:hypothetical protein